MNIKAKILLLPGDGIGPEICNAVKYIINVLDTKTELDFIVDEQLGDSFYQLGFLFTITALAVTLLFIEDDEVGKILTKFGFAVVTTLVGLVGRILLSQFRMDIS